MTSTRDRYSARISELRAAAAASGWTEEQAKIYHYRLDSSPPSIILSHTAGRGESGESGESGEVTKLRMELTVAESGTISTGWLEVRTYVDGDVFTQCDYPLLKSRSRGLTVPDLCPTQNKRLDQVLALLNGPGTVPGRVAAASAKAAEDREVEQRAREAARKAEAERLDALPVRDLTDLRRAAGDLRRAAADLETVDGDTDVRAVIERAAAAVEELRAQLTD